MPHPRPWSVVDSEPLQDCRVFRVRRTRARSPTTGEDRAFFCIDAAEWVNVVPVTADDEIVMVRQYRHGADALTLEIPGGMVDPGETPSAAAARELREETGYAAASLSALGRVNPNPALFGNGCHTFLAHGARRVGAIENPGDEETAVELVPRSEIPARLRSGEIDHALVVAALFFFELRGTEG